MWDRYVQYHVLFGDAASVLAVEQQRDAAFAEDPSVVSAQGSAPASTSDRGGRGGGRGSGGGRGGGRHSVANKPLVVPQPAAEPLLARTSFCGLLALDPPTLSFTAAVAGHAGGLGGGAGPGGYGAAAPALANGRGGDGGAEGSGQGGGGSDVGGGRGGGGGGGGLLRSRPARLPSRDRGDGGGSSLGIGDRGGDRGGGGGPGSGGESLDAALHRLARGVGPVSRLLQLPEVEVLMGMVSRTPSRLDDTPAGSRLARSEEGVGGSGGGKRPFGGESGGGGGATAGGPASKRQAVESAGGGGAGAGAPPPPASDIFRARQAQKQSRMR